MSEEELMRLIIEWMMANADCGNGQNDRGQGELVVFDDRAWFDARELAKYIKVILHV